MRIQNYFIILFILNMFACQQEIENRTIVIKGSESIIQIIKQASGLIKVEQNIPHPEKERIKHYYYKLKSNPEYTLHFVGGGSSRAMAAIIDQTADIAIVNRTFTDDHKDLLRQNHVTAIRYALAHSEIYFIVNQKNPILSLRLTQLKGIFSGRIPNWRLEQEENIKSRELVRLKAQSKTKDRQGDSTQEFNEHERIDLAGRRTSSGNHFWVYKEVLQARGFSRDLRDFIDDQDIVDYVSNNKYAIGYISKNYFDSIYTADDLNKIESKLDKSVFISPEERKKLTVGLNVKRLLVYDDFNAKGGQAFKYFHLVPEIYLIVPDKNAEAMKIKQNELNTYEEEIKEDSKDLLDVRLMLDKVKKDLDGLSVRQDIDRGKQNKMRLSLDNKRKDLESIEEELASHVKDLNEKALNIKGKIEKLKLNSKKLDPVIQFFYSQEISKLLRSNSLTPIKNSSKNQHLLP